MSKRTTAAFVVSLSIVIAISGSPSNARAATGDIVCPHLTLDLKRGDYDQIKEGQVTELQTFLVSLYELDASNNISGYFGQRTVNNVKRFQNQFDLPVAGRVGPQTRAKVAEVCAGSPNIALNTVPVPVVSACIFNGQQILEGASVTAYLLATVNVPNTCQAVAELRTCSGGNLTGTFAYATCNQVVNGGVAQNSILSPANDAIIAETEPFSGNCKTNGSEYQLAVSGGVAPTLFTCINHSYFDKFPFIHVQPGLYSVTLRRSGGGEATHTKSFTLAHAAVAPVAGSIVNGNTTTVTTPGNQWMIGDWGICVNGQQDRVVQCVADSGTIIADTNCMQPKPSLVQSCMIGASVSGAQASSQITSPGEGFVVQPGATFTVAGTCPLPNKKVNVGIVTYGGQYMATASDTCNETHAFSVTFSSYTMLHSIEPGTWLALVIPETYGIIPDPAASSIHFTMGGVAYDSAFPARISNPHQGGRVGYVNSMTVSGTCPRRLHPYTLRLQGVIELSGGFMCSSDNRFSRDVDIGHYANEGYLYVSISDSFNTVTLDKISLWHGDSMPAYPQCSAPPEEIATSQCPTGTSGLLQSVTTYSCPVPNAIPVPTTDVTACS